MTESETKLYGVSSGDGNNGVSHMFADYYVRTNEPWTLARAAMLAEFKTGKGHAFALANMEIDGEAEYTISAMILNPPCEDTEDGSYPECDNEEEAEDGRNWSEANGAWLIVEVFPDNEPREGRPVYESIDDALSEDVVALARKEEP